ncbi:MAG TPA: NAD(P)/FAD-dependent oxidoreductase [Phycisphaerae bacterium]
MRYDAIVIGAGHNGLVAACYLARAGRRVLVLERRNVVGGCCTTEEVFPGCKVSTAAYVNGIFHPKIAADLKLRQYGFEVLERNPSSFTPFLDGRHLLLGPDQSFNCREIAKFSARDAEAFPRYETMLNELAEFVEPTLLEPPPDPLASGLADLWQLGSVGRKARKLGPRLGELVRIMTGSARHLLDGWFESDALKATLATDAIIGAFAAPSSPGTGYVLFHHVMGETNGARGVWGFVRGGMGGLTNALAGAARAMGVEIHCTSPVASIKTRNGQAVGVVLTDGREFEARAVLSNADCNVTFLKLVGAQHLPDEFVTAVRRIRYDSASLKINLLLSELPRFDGANGTSAAGMNPAARHLCGTIHICESLDYIERAFDDAKYGQPSREPVLECTLPSVVDETVCPPGRHLMNMFVQYAPYRLTEDSGFRVQGSGTPSPAQGEGWGEGGSADWDRIKDAFADRCLEVLARYAPNVKKAIIARQVLSPLDLEREFGLTGGNIFQGAMTLDQLLFMRPVPGWSHYRTPIKGLYLCGAAAHPGGGVMGACGYNAAHQVLKDRI